MHFCNQRKHFAEPSILLDKTPIKVVTKAKFLGVIFDRILSYSSPRSGELRAQKIKSHLVRTQSLNVLPFKPGVGQYIAIHATLTAREFFVRSKLDYGCIVYGAASNNILKKLDPIHHQGLRIALGAFRTSPVTSPVSYTHLTLPTTAEV